MKWVAVLVALLGLLVHASEVRNTDETTLYKKLETTERQFDNPIYFALRRANSFETVGSPLYEGFSICPTDFSSTGVTIECVSAQSTVADFYVNNVFVRRESAKPFTITSQNSAGQLDAWAVPRGPITFHCYTERWYTWVNGIFECASESQITPSSPPTSSPVPSQSAPAPATEWTEEPAPPQSAPATTTEWIEEPTALESQSTPDPTPATENNNSEPQEEWVEPEHEGNEFPSLVDSGSFRPVYPAGPTLPKRRIESCIAVVNGKVYLIGGADGRYPVAEFDPVSSEWTIKQRTPVQMHHHACVTYGRNIYVVGSWTGNYPTQTSHAETWVYNTENDSWHTVVGLPEWRRRGSGAAAIHGSKIYFAAGSRGGYRWHTELRPYLDVLDLENLDAGWVALDNVPDARDHTQGGIAGGWFCIAGGRDGSQEDFINFPVRPINCFNLEGQWWERRADLPVARSGASVTGTCQGLLMIAGGESGSRTMSHSEVDLYDPVHHRFLDPIRLRFGRHGSGLAGTECSCGNIYTIAGGARRGGGLELNDIEVWSPDGEKRDC